MRLKKMTNKFSKTPLSVRKTEQMEKMLKYLEVKLQLNPTAIMRLGLATLYRQEKNKETLKCQ